MAIRVTLSDEVATYLEGQSLTQNKSCDQIADELIRQVISSDNDGDDIPVDGESSIASHHGKLNPALEGQSLNQIIDDIYVEDYMEKARAV